MKIVYFLLKYRKIKLFFVLLKILGIEIPKQVIIGNNIILPHLGGNIVIHPKCIIGNNVSIFQGVTVGRSDPWRKNSDSNSKVIIEDDVLLCAGSKVIFGSEDIVIREGSILAANAVLTKSTGRGEIWGGIPAKKISMREKNTSE